VSARNSLNLRRTHWTR